jgi:5-methylcytosine-specific restriction endonuclease McrA
VLNASYEPIKVVGWQKAILLWFQGKVEVIEHYDQCVRSVSASFQLPSVIRLKSYVKKRQVPFVRFSRENVYLRDQQKCQYCDDFFQAKELTLDHVLPVSQGGRKSWTNVVTACKTCNQKKAARTPEQAGMPLKKAPKAPSWLPTHQVETRGQIPETWRIYLMSLPAQAG